MNSALLSRFDLVFILLDRPDAEMDAHISEHIMKTHSGNGKGISRGKWTAPGSTQGDSQSTTHDGIQARLIIDGQFDPIPPALLRKYVAYARNYCHPVLTKEAAAVLQNFYLDLREKVSDAI
jgi:DNA helicase MCM8